MKSLFGKFGAWSGLTKKELMIIGFLAVSFIAGLIIKYSGWKNPEDHDYSEPDRKFETQIKSAFDDPDNSKFSNEQQQKIRELKLFADSLSVLKESTTQTPSILKPGTKININTAYAGDLQLLPGIGEVMAERIVEYRERSGGFKNTDELKKVKGIGVKKFEKIREYITIE
jgi:competence ComEA-like helix-hairpin-helix protein